MKLDRRKFLGAALASEASALAAQGGKRRSPSDVFRVGCLNVVTYSHLNELWAPLMNPRDNQKDAPLTGMRITHCWEIDPDKSAQFARTFGCTAVRNFDDMLGKVDGIISGGYYNHPWNHILHQPYLEAGLPNLINRPFANSMAKARRMVEMAQKHGAKILVPSSHEFNDPITHAKAWAGGKKILCYNATNSFDDYPSHGVHGVYLVCRAVAESGSPVVSVAYQARNWYSPPGVLTFEHRDPQGRPFFGTLHQLAGSWGTIQIHTPEEYGGKDFLIQTGTGYPFNRTEIWAPPVWVYQYMALYGEMPQSFEQILHKTNVFLAGWRSILDQGGRPVRLEEVPEEWESPVELPTHPGDPTVSLFRKKFGKE
ncbi:MAG TPA: Gfo/Idh/MocA family oxidoreductase [Bryobacteraceae bacterium]|nr:Gfo/Idh/MocA family oxidoreductase [Bryobacteraceae bacterium]